ncbi:MAG: DUF58 domain-containing protein [Chloroflexota bacterium]
MPHFLAFVIGLFVVAALFRVDFFFYLLYLFFGIYLLSRWWTQRGLRSVTFARHYSDHALLGEQVPVRLEIHNRGLLPLPWLRVHESLPIQIKAPNLFRCVTSLLPYERRTVAYELDCRRRGHYPLGPLLLSAGDLFGLREVEQRYANQDAITVYPRIVPLRELGLPAQSPFGDVPSKQRIFEDPTRLMGVREYQAGDSQRHIHWTASAATGTLQVKRFEPAISIEALILLNLNRPEYTVARAGPASELAIVTAASVANHLAGKRQAIGLCCSGADPLQNEEQPIILPPRKGHDQLMRILDALARVELGDKTPYQDLVRRARLHLTWGGMAILITAHAGDDLFDAMVLLKRGGFHVVLVVVDPQTPFLRVQQRVRAIGVQAHQVWQERDLDVWR